MIVCEFSVVPLDKGASVSAYVAECLKVVRKSRLPHELTAMGTIVEGTWEEVMTVVKDCHDAVRQHASRVLTTVRVDDREGPGGRISSKVQSVETKVSGSA